MWPICSTLLQFTNVPSLFPMIRIHCAKIVPESNIFKTIRVNLERKPDSSIRLKR